MNIPLSVKAFIDKSGKQKLEIWNNGVKQIVDPPFKPYFLSKRSLNEWSKNFNWVDVKSQPTLLDF